MICSVGEMVNVVGPDHVSEEDISTEYNVFRAFGGKHQ